MSNTPYGISLLREQVLLPGEPSPKGQDRPYTQPINWKEWERQFGSRPYASPRQELVENYFYPTFPQIWNRWEGFAEQQEILKVYNTPQVLAERDAFIRENFKEVDLSFLDEPDYLKRENYRDVQRLDLLINRLSATLDEDSEQKWINEGSAKDGYKPVLHVIPLTPAQRSRVSMTIAALMKQRAMFQGRAGDIKEERHTAGGALGDALDEWLKKANMSDIDGFDFKMIAEKVAQEKALPSGDAVPKDAVEQAIEAQVMSEVGEL